MVKQSKSESESDEYGYDTEEYDAETADSKLILAAVNEVLLPFQKKASKLILMHISDTSSPEHPPADHFIRGQKAAQGLKEENKRMETVVSKAQDEVNEWRQKYNEAAAVVEQLKKEKREMATKNFDLDKASGAFSKLVEDYSAKCTKLQDVVGEIRMINDKIEEQCLAARKEAARLRLEMGRRL